MSLKVAILLFVVGCLWRVNAWEISGDDLDFERQLKILNKPALRTFKTKDGDIIDCVDIYAQPALDHPLLKKHKVQTNPSASFLTQFPKSSHDVKYALVVTREPCPNGTVPITRVTKQDLIRARSLPEEPSSRDGQTDRIVPRQHVVFLKINTPYTPKYGGGGITSVYNLIIQSDQFSSVQLWIETRYDDSDMIIAGWRIYPALNGDGLTRLVTYWKGKENKGCHNTLCPGFVQVDKVVTPNYPLIDTSTPGGKQRVLTFQILQDRNTKNWWFIVYNGDIQYFIGYWPSELFDHLSSGSDLVVFGGVGMAGDNGMVPPLGSGRWPDGDYSNSCYFAKLHYIDSTNKSADLPAVERLFLLKDQCAYSLKYFGYVDDPLLEFNLQLGGPARNCSQFVPRL